MITDVSCSYREKGTRERERDSSYIPVSLVRSARLPDRESVLLHHASENAFQARVDDFFLFFLVRSDEYRTSKNRCSFVWASRWIDLKRPLPDQSILSHFVTVQSHPSVEKFVEKIFHRFLPFVDRHLQRAITYDFHRPVTTFSEAHSSLSTHLSRCHSTRL